MMKTDLKILYEDNHIIVLVKPKDVLSQGDKTGDISMVDIVKDYLKEKYQKTGNVYLGLVHRLDRRVSGVMVFSKTSKGASRLSEAIRSHSFKKKYLAICLGRVESGRFTNNLEKVDGHAVESNSGKESILEYELIKHFKLDGVTYSLVSINLITGRYNQIRSQFALNNHPLLGDFKYGYRGKNYFDDIGLYCYYISFSHPITKEILEFKDYPNVGVWKLVEGINNGE